LKQVILWLIVLCFEQFEEKYCMYEKAYGVKVIRINDGDGVFIDGEVHVYKL